MAKTKAEILIDLIIARAPALYAAGITSLTVDGLSVALVAPPPPPAAPLVLPKPTERPKQHIDPLKDTSTYPGGRIPGFTRDDEDPYR